MLCLRGTEATCCSDTMMRSISAMALHNVWHPLSIGLPCCSCATSCNNVRWRGAWRKFSSLCLAHADPKVHLHVGFVICSDVFVTPRLCYAVSILGSSNMLYSSCVIDTVISAYVTLHPRLSTCFSHVKYEPWSFIYSQCYSFAFSSLCLILYVIACISINDFCYFSVACCSVCRTLS